MELGSLLINDTYTLQLRHPATQELLFEEGDENKPVTITLYSTSSKPHRQALEKIVKRNAQNKGTSKSLATIREESTELLVACSVGSTYLKFNGEDVNSPEAFAAVYREPNLSWVREQVDAALSDTANFISA